MLNHLREITREYLFLGTHSIPELPGVPQGCVFYPYLDDDARAAFTRPHWGDLSGGWGVGTPFVETPMLGHGNFWWGMTPSALRAMLRAARFEVVAEPRTHASPWYTDIVARPVDRDPVLPPVSYYRERGEARAAGERDPAARGLLRADQGARRAAGRPRPDPLRRAADGQQAVEYADVPDGGSVAVLGLGPIGEMASRIAQHRGYRVFGSDPVAERRECSAAHGVEIVEADVTEAIREFLTDVPRARTPWPTRYGMEGHGSDDRLTSYPDVLPPA